MKLPLAYYEAIAILTGCIIGAGILAIPFVVIRAGFWTGMLVILGLGFSALVINLLVGEVSLRSNKCQQLAGYAERYLGAYGKYLMAASMVIGVYGALIAYTLGISESLQALFGGPVWVWAVLFYILMSWLIYGGIGIIGKSELWLEILKFGIFGVVLAILFFSPYFSSARFTSLDWSRILLPFGVILFAYMGTAAIPELREGMKLCRLLTRRAIIIGSLIPILVYALFTAAVIGVTGIATTEVATIGLGLFVGGIGFVLLNLFAILAMATSFIALGYALKDMYHMDFKLPHWESWALTVIIPATLLLTGVQSFVRTLEISGVFAGGIAGITIVLVHMRARKRSDRKPEYVIKINGLGYSFLIALFVIGMIYELWLFV